MKTTVNDANPKEFLNSIENDQRRNDGFLVLELMRKLSGEEPKMWGTSIIGFGTYQYKYASGKEGDWPLIGFSPRKQSLSLYIMTGFERYEEILLKLGKFKIGKSCLYINKLSDVNEDILIDLISSSLNYLRQNKFK